MFASGAQAKQIPTKTLESSILPGWARHGGRSAMNRKIAEVQQADWLVRKDLLRLQRGGCEGWGRGHDMT